MGNITLKDIAKKAGVSEATVSLVLNNKSVVNSRTRERVLKCIEEMNYKPNPLARGLALRKSMTIGLVCPDSENPYYGKLMKLLGHYCNQYGYSLVLGVSNNNPDMETRIMENFVDKQYDGIIVLPLNIRKNESRVFTDVKENKIPIVFCTSYYTGFTKDCVLTDYAEGSYQLTRYLLENGHRELWYFVTSDKKLPVAQERISGYRRAFAEMGLDVEQDWIVGCDDISVEYGYAKTKQLLQSGRTPDGILALNDYMAYGIKKAIQECGYRIPEDISLAGYDDVFYHLIADKPLTTVHQDLDSMAANTVNLLMQKMNKDFQPKQPVQHLIRPSLVVRKTTKGD